MCQLRKKQSYYRAWRINEDLLYKQEMINQIKNDIYSYFEINATPEMDPATLWDAFKAVIRGRLISLNSIEKRKRV